MRKATHNIWKKTVFQRVTLGGGGKRKEKQEGGGKEKIMTREQQLLRHKGIGKHEIDSARSRGHSRA